MVRTGSRDLFGAAFVASLAAPGVVTVVALFGELASTRDLIGAVIIAGYLAGLLALPISLLMTFGLGLPLILAWRHWHGRVGALAATLFGLALGAAPIVFLAALDRVRPLPLVVPASVFAACGAAVSLTFWCLALRDE